MKSSGPQKILGFGVSILLVTLLALVVIKRPVITPPARLKPSPSATPQPSPSRKPVPFTLGRGQGQRLLDEHEGDGSQAAFALCENEQFYSLVFETVQTTENMDVTYGRYYAGELIDHIGTRYRPQERVQFGFVKTCVFLHGIDPSAIRVGHLAECQDRVAEFDEQCRHNLLQDCPSSTVDSLRDAHLLAADYEIMICKKQPVVDEVFLADLVARKNKDCYYGSNLQVNSQWYVLDSYPTTYRRYNDDDKDEHCWIDGGDAFDETSYFDRSTRLHVKLVFWYEDHPYVLAETTVGEGLNITLYRLQDGKAEYETTGGGYNVPL